MIFSSCFRGLKQDDFFLTNYFFQFPLSALRPVYDAASAAQQLGDLTTGRAFDNLCVCPGLAASAVCVCGAKRLAPEQHFVQALVSISTRLAPLPDKDTRTQSLLASLSMLNLNLPARVWLPLYAADIPHYIVRYGNIYLRLKYF